MHCFKPKEAETVIIKKIISLKESQAQALVLYFARYKALAIALNPLALLDLLGGAITDLLLIRALSKLYGFPVTYFEAK